MKLVNFKVVENSQKNLEAVAQKCSLKKLSALTSVAKITIYNINNIIKYISVMEYFFKKNCISVL